LQPKEKKMMGQQQQTVAGSALRRIILALAIAAVMVAMMVASVSPAFAKKQGQTMTCSYGSELRIVTSDKQVIKELEREGYTCSPN
jgi:hypothetical protein